MRELHDLAAQRPERCSQIEVMSETSSLVKDVASSVASQLGLPSPNSLLATNLISLAKKIPTEHAFVRAAKGFGRFDESFLRSIREEIQARATAKDEPLVGNDCRKGSSPIINMGDGLEVRSSQGLRICESFETQEPSRLVQTGLSVMGGADVSRAEQQSSISANQFSRLTETCISPTSQGKYS